MVKSIFLQDGEEIFVDDEDYERVNQHTWHKKFTGNTRQIASTINDKKYVLQSFILKNSFQINKNNYFTKDNLTTLGNKSRWEKARCNSSSKYKGVSWDKRRNKWRAQIDVDGKTKSLGRYLKEDEAARAYNKAVLDYWNGEGYLNVIGEDNRLKERDYKTYKNQNIYKVGSSRYKGVIIYGNKYIKVCITHGGKSVHVSTFDNKHQAALAYNKCAIYLYGDDAILNDVPMTEELKEFISNWEIPERIKKLKKV